MEEEPALLIMKVETEIEKGVIASGQRIGPQTNSTSMGSSGS